jgi:hypothetical protein
MCRLRSQFSLIALDGKSKPPNPRKSFPSRPGPPFSTRLCQTVQLRFPASAATEGGQKCEIRIPLVCWRGKRVQEFVGALREVLVAKPAEETRSVNVTRRCHAHRVEFDCHPLAGATFGCF